MNHIHQMLARLAASRRNNPSAGTAPYAQGGIVTNIGNDTIHTFETSSVLNVFNNSLTIEYLLVAGGGGSPRIPGAGGGGGGGVLTGTTTLPVGTYTITVGAGGVNSNGENTTAFSLTAIGGGRSGEVGGSGGGGSVRFQIHPPGAGTPGQGNVGGSTFSSPSADSAGGGGGAGSAGGSGTDLAGGAGGNGIQSSISGTAQHYGGGGGGYSDWYDENGGTPTEPGAGGLGGGGNGTAFGLANGTNGVDGFGGGAGGGTPSGGSGIVIVRYTNT